jgi:hypothetical protein
MEKKAGNFFAPSMLLICYLAWGLRPAKGISVILLHEQNTQNTKDGSDRQGALSS